MKKIIGGTKDENGIFTKAAPEADPADIHIDDLLTVSLRVIRRALLSVQSEVNLGEPSRNAVMNLKDIVSMLRDLKKDERDILDNLTDEELEKLK